MGRRDKKYSKSLKEQANEKLESYLHAGVGVSRNVAKRTGDDKDKIFSYNTYKTYKKWCGYFTDYVKENHPEATTLKAAKQYIPEYLNSRINLIDDNGNHLSAWTLSTEKMALYKLYQISPVPGDALYVETPRRNRSDIKRSRNSVQSFSEDNNRELVNFCKATGCRRNVLERLTSDDYYSIERMKEELEDLSAKTELTKIEASKRSALREAIDTWSDQDAFVFHSRDKGGRSRFAPIIGAHKEDAISRFIESEGRLFNIVPHNCPTHQYRSDYAKDIYRMYARDIKDIPYDKYHPGLRKMIQSEVYTCRGDMVGAKYDRVAVGRYVSRSLGHSRADTAITNYLRNI